MSRTRILRLTVITLVMALLTPRLSHLAWADQHDGGAAMRGTDTALRLTLIAAVLALAIHRRSDTSRADHRDGRMVAGEQRMATGAEDQTHMGDGDDRTEIRRDGRRERLFDQIDIGLLSLGGRAAYVNPGEGGGESLFPRGGEWHGGAQLRLYPSRYIAIEGSADYRQSEVNRTRTHTYPVQVSALLYPLGTTRLAPYVLGGGG